MADHLTKGKSWCGIDEIIRGVGVQMTVIITDKGNGPRRKEWQRRSGPCGINFARGGTWEGREGSERAAGCPDLRWKTRAL